MKLNKIIITTLILLTLTLTLGPISASENFKVTDNIISYEDMEFNIPDGYELSAQDTSHADDDFPTVNCSLVNGDKKIKITIILIGVTSQSFNPDGSAVEEKETTINGQQGTISQGSTGYYTFKYTKASNSISIDAPDEETLKEVVR